MIPPASIFRAMLFVGCYFLFRISDTTMVIPLHDGGRLVIQALGISPLIPLLGIFFISFFVPLKVCKLATKNDAIIEPIRRRVAVIGYVCLFFYLSSILADVFLESVWTRGFFEVLTVYFFQFLALDISFCMFALGIMSAPGTVLPFWKHFICALAGSVVSLAIMFLVSNLVIYGKPTAVALLCVPIVVALVELGYRRFGESLPFLSVRGFWTLRVAFYFSLLLWLSFLFVPLTPFPLPGTPKSTPYF